MVTWLDASDGSCSDFSSGEPPSRILNAKDDAHDSGYSSEGSSFQESDTGEPNQDETFTPLTSTRIREQASAATGGAQRERKPATCDEEDKSPSFESDVQSEDDEGEIEEPTVDAQILSMRDLLANCSNISVVTATVDQTAMNSGTCGRRSARFNRSRSSKADFALPVLTDGHFQNLQELHALIVKVDRTSTLHRTFAVQLTLVDPRLALLEKSMLSLWRALWLANDLSKGTDDRTHLAICQLMTIFEFALSPPNRDWIFADNADRAAVYLSNLQVVKSSFVDPVFWAEVSASVEHAKKFIAANGLVGSYGDRINELRQKIYALSQDGAEFNTQNVYIELLDAERELEKLNVKLETTLKIEVAHIGRVRNIILYLIRLRDSPQFFQRAGLSVGSPLQYKKEDSARLMLHYITAHAPLMSIFEDSWQTLLDLDLFPRNRRREIDTLPVDTAAIWRCIEFYSWVAVSFTPEDLRTHRHSSHQSACAVIPVSQRNRYSRHSRFNPLKARRTLFETKGAFSYFSSNDRRRSRKRRQARSAIGLVKKSSIFPQLAFEDINLAPPGFVGLLGDEGRCSYASIDCSSRERLAQALDLFLYKVFNKFVDAGVADCRALEPLSESFGRWKILNLISWFLSWKRHAIIDRITLSASGHKDGATPDPTETSALFQRLTISEICALRSAVTATGLRFAAESLHQIIKRKRLAQESSRLARVATRALYEQLSLGMLLYNSSLESAVLSANLIAVGKTIAEHVFHSNITSDIVWCLRNVNVRQHDELFIAYLLSLTLLIIDAFKKLGGDVTVVEPRRERRATESAVVPLDGVARRLAFREFLNDISDGRVVGNLMSLLRTYAANEESFNRATVDLLRLIMNERSQQGNSRIGLLFQLSYFDFFFKILTDNDVMPSARSMKELVADIVETFFELYQQNRLLPLELLYAKNAAATRGYSVAEEASLASVFSNYEKGTDRQFAGLNREDEISIDEWHQRRLIERRRKLDAWTLEEIKMLLKAWDLKKGQPGSLRLTRKAARLKKTLSSIKTKLAELRVIEFDDTRLEDGRTQTEDLLPPSLSSAVRSFLQSAPTESFDAVESRVCVLNALTMKLQDWVDDAEIFEERRKTAQNTITVKEFPLQAEEFRMVLEALNFRELVTTSQAENARTPNNTSGGDDLMMELTPSTTHSDFSERVKSLRNALTETQNLQSRTAKYGHGSRFTVEDLCKVRVLGALALLKVCATRSANPAIWSDDLLAELSKIAQEAREAEAAVCYHPLPHSGADTFFDENCLLPLDLSVSDVGSALAAAYDAIIRSRKRYLLEHGIFSATKIEGLSALRFHKGLLSSPTSRPVVKLLSTSHHPLVAILLRILGFKPDVKEAVVDTSSANEADANSPKLAAPEHVSTGWKLDVNISLQLAEANLHFLRAYTMTPLWEDRSKLRRFVALASGDNTLSKEPLNSQEKSGDGKKSTSDAFTQFLEKELSPANMGPREIEEFPLECSPKEIGKVVKAVKQFRKTCLPHNRNMIDQAKVAVGSLSLVIRKWLDQRIRCETTERLIIRLAENENCPSSINCLPLLLPFRQSLTFNRCVYSIFGRPDNELQPMTWSWSFKLSVGLITKLLDVFESALSMHEKTLSRLRHGKISYEDALRRESCAPGSEAPLHSDTKGERIFNPVDTFEGSFERRLTSYWTQQIDAANQDNFPAPKHSAVQDAFHTFLGRSESTGMRMQGDKFRCLLRKFFVL